MEARRPALITNSADETRQLGRDLAPRLQGGENLLLFGDLGSGKTAFVQGLAAGLGVSEPVKSPTFIYLREYQLPLRSTRLAHYDLYRLPEQPKADDLRSLELFERLADQDVITVIEWAERLQAHLEQSHLPIRFTMAEADQRRIELPTRLRRGPRR